MDQLKPAALPCPYCGETIEVLIDGSVQRQEYVEDCQVCCRPITLVVTLSGNEITGLEGRREDE